MRVLHFVKTSVGATWALRQVRELVGLGIDVHVAVPPGGPLVDVYHAVGAYVHPVQFDFPIRAPQSFAAMARELRNLVTSVRPDLIHSHFVGTTLSLRLALGNRLAIPRLFQVPGPLHLEHPLFRHAEIATAGQHDYWIGSCEWTCRRYVASGIPANKIFLSYYGVDVEHFQRRSAGKLRTELQLSPDQKIIGMVAYMYAPKRYLGHNRGIKGHEDLIDATKLYIKSNPELVLVFIGGAWNNAFQYEQQVRDYARSQLGGKVHFLGTRSDVPELYPDLDVVVHPSHSENVGGAVESLLGEVPTIATNVGGFPDLIVNGETGWLVPPRSPASIAAALECVFADEQTTRQMVVKGAERARNMFDVKTTAREVAAIYSAILGGRQLLPHSAYTTNADWKM